MTLLKSKKYKAILFDIDGTLILNKKDAVPSLKVKEAIAKANNNVHVGIVTSRPYYMAQSIFNDLKLSGPSIISGGSQIVNVESGNALWEKTVDAEIIENIYKAAKEFNVNFNINDDGNHVQFSKEYIPKKPLSIWIHGFSYSDVEIFTKTISNIHGIVTHKLPSWKINRTDVLITHKFADKKHAVNKLAKLLQIKTEEIIGVGDGHNDIPLLESCGLKIAMGNGVPELKEIADYVSPPVEKDGVADIIKRFVL